jgi:hypothetical protein
MTDHEPDSIELNDWTLEHAPEVHEATQYLSDGAAQYRIRLMAWSQTYNPLPTT